MLISKNKIDFKPKTLYNDKGVNSPRRYNNHKYIYIQYIQ